MKKYKQKPKIVVDEKTKNKLDKFGKKGNTYNDVINMLINKYLTKNEKKTRTKNKTS